MRNKIAKGALIAFALIGTLALGACSIKSNLSPDAAKAKAEKFINDNLMAPGSKAKIDSIVEDGGLYKLSVNIGQGKPIESYLTKDGSKFFPNVINIAEVEKQAAASNNATAGNTTPAVALPKTDKPVVELFVMSYCPFGTQIEKGIIPVVETLGSKIDFQLKFVDYSMHGDKELKENMVQYCIMTGQSAKFLPYLKCFLNSSDSASCLASTGVAQSKVDTCVAKVDKKYQITAKTENKGSYPAFNIFKDDNAKYSVAGSPTLIVNGVSSESDRDPASLLKTICSAFKTAPAACDTKLSTTRPSSGFGSAADTSGGTAAGCGQ